MELWSSWHSFFPLAAAKLDPENPVLGLRVRKLQMLTPTEPLQCFQPWFSTNCWEKTHSRNPGAGALLSLIHAYYYVQFETISPHLIACSHIHQHQHFWGTRRNEMYRQNQRLHNNCTVIKQWIIHSTRITYLARINCKMRTPVNLLSYFGNENLCMFEIWCLV